MCEQKKLTTSTQLNFNDEHLHMETNITAFNKSQMNEVWFSEQQRF